MQTKLIIAWGRHGMYRVVKHGRNTSRTTLLTYIYVATYVVSHSVTGAHTYNLFNQIRAKLRCFFVSTCWMHGAHIFFCYFLHLYFLTIFLHWAASQWAPYASRGRFSSTRHKLLQCCYSVVRAGRIKFHRTKYELFVQRRNIFYSASFHCNFEYCGSELL